MTKIDYLSLSSINSPIRLLALTLVVVELALGGLIFSLDKNDRLIAFGIFGGLVSLTILTLFAIERLRATALAISQPKLNVRVIPSRREVYLECAKLVTNANMIFDTTWGNDPRPRSRPEDIARNEYRRALDASLKAGKTYRELFDGPEDDEYCMQASKTKARYSNYEARRVPSTTGHSMLEFLIADNDKVVLSHVDARNEIPMYLLIESTEVVDLFTRLHREHWANAHEIRAVTTT